MTVTSVVTVPATALLVPEVATGAAHELADLREAALRAVGELVADVDRILVVAGTNEVDAPQPVASNVVASWSRIGLDFEIPLDGRLGDNTDESESDGRQIPIAVALGAWLLNACSDVTPREYLAVPVDPAAAPHHEAVSADRLGILVLADGSCTRGPKAPGAQVDGAIEHDQALQEALASVDTAWFLDPRRVDDAQRFKAQGLAAWALAARVISRQGGAWSGQVLATADPYGVFYVVSTWRPQSG